MILALLAAIATEATELLGQLDANLAVLSTAIILISSLILSPEASERLKKAIPLVVGGLLVAIEFLVTGLPENESLMEALDAFVMGTAIAVAFYGSVSGFIAQVTGRSLNELTGPGLLGRGGQDR